MVSRSNGKTLRTARNVKWTDFWGPRRWNEHNKDSRAGISSFSDFASIAYELVMLEMQQVEYHS